MAVCNIVTYVANIFKSTQWLKVTGIESHINDNQGMKEKQ